MSLSDFKHIPIFRIWGISGWDAFVWEGSLKISTWNGRDKLARWANWIPSWRHPICRWTCQAPRKTVFVKKLSKLIFTGELSRPSKKLGKASGRNSQVVEVCQFAWQARRNRNWNAVKLNAPKWISIRQIGLFWQKRFVYPLVGSGPYRL